MTGVYLFDTEATDRKDGEIIESCLARVPDEESLFGPEPRAINRSAIYLKNFEYTVARWNPSKPSTMGAQAVHHILPCELEGCPPSSEFRLPADCGYLIGHAVDFDWKIAGSPEGVKRICTHAIAGWLWPEATGYSLVALIYMLRGSTPETREFVRGAHGAGRDCEMLLDLLHAILTAKPEIESWESLWEYSEECRIPRTCPMKKYEGVPLTELDEGFMSWCLRQDWLDPYFRKGIEREFDRRYPPPPPTPRETATAGDLGDDDLPF